MPERRSAIPPDELLERPIEQLSAAEFHLRAQSPGPGPGRGPSASRQEEVRTLGRRDRRDQAHHPRSRRPAAQREEEGRDRAHCEAPGRDRRARSQELRYQSGSGRGHRRTRCGAAPATMSRGEVVLILGEGGDPLIPPLQAALDATGLRPLLMRSEGFASCRVTCDESVEVDGRLIQARSTARAGRAAWRPDSSPRTRSSPRPRRVPPSSTSSPTHRWCRSTGRIHRPGIQCRAGGTGATGAARPG